jgi:GNAT superfamily N-acetyltransferase
VTTGPDFHESHRLRDGMAVDLRHIRPDDAPELARRFKDLSLASRHQRFFSSLAVLSDELLHYLTHVDGHDHVAIVATTRAPSGHELGVGVARFIRMATAPTVAEPAITVSDEYQGRGLGYLLALTLARAARERGVTHFRGPILADNTQVRQLLEELGAELHRSEDGLVFDIAIGDDWQRTARELLRAGVDRALGDLHRGTPR